jgi:hypothetical protein
MRYAIKTAKKPNAQNVDEIEVIIDKTIPKINGIVILINGYFLISSDKSEYIPKIY